MEVVKCDKSAIIPLAMCASSILKKGVKDGKTYTLVAGPVSLAISDNVEENLMSIAVGIADVNIALEDLAIAISNATLAVLSTNQLDPKLLEDVVEDIADVIYVTENPHTLMFLRNLAVSLTQLMATPVKNLYRVIDMLCEYMEELIPEKYRLEIMEAKEITCKLREEVYDHIIDLERIVSAQVKSVNGADVEMALRKYKKAVEKTINIYRKVSNTYGDLSGKIEVVEEKS